MAHSQATDCIKDNKETTLERNKSITGLLVRQAIQRASDILSRIEKDGADFVRMDEHHMYIWHREELVNLYDHQHLIRFLEKHAYMPKRTANKMIVAAWIIFQALQRCS